MDDSKQLKKIESEEQNEPVTAAPSQQIFMNVQKEFSDKPISTLYKALAAIAIIVSGLVYIPSEVWSFLYHGIIFGTVFPIYMIHGTYPKKDAPARPRIIPVLVLILGFFVLLGLLDFQKMEPGGPLLPAYTVFVKMIASIWVCKSISIEWEKWTEEIRRSISVIEELAENKSPIVVESDNKPSDATEQ